jgi:hypothetical protein
MSRLRKTIAVLIAPSVLFGSVCRLVPGMQENAILMASIFAGIVTYGYVVLDDEEFNRRAMSPRLLAFALAVAGVTTIFRIVFDGVRDHQSVVPSSLIAGLWVGVIVYVVVRTPLLKDETTQ